MTGREVIRTILDEKHLGYKELNELVGDEGYSTTQMAFFKTRGKDLSAKTLTRYASALGYKIVAVPKWGVTDEKVISYDD